MAAIPTRSRLDRQGLDGPVSRLTINMPCSFRRAVACNLLGWFPLAVVRQRRLLISSFRRTVWTFRRLPIAFSSQRAGQMRQ